MINLLAYAETWKNMDGGIDIEDGQKTIEHAQCSRATRSPSVGKVSPDENTRLLLRSSIVIVDEQRKHISPLEVLIPFFVYCLAVGAVAVPKINIVLALLCIKNDRNSVSPSRGAITPDDICGDAAVHAEMGRFVGYGNLLSGILCAFTSQWIGKLSDHYGRKPFIAFSALGMFSGDAISVLAACFRNKISVYFILLEFVIGGLTGAFLTTAALIQSYITDILPDDERTTWFSLLHACMYLGSALGPAVGALVVRHVGKGDMLTIFYAAGFCHALFILYVLVILPESVPPSRRSAQTESTAAPQQPSKYRLLSVRNLIPLRILVSSRLTSPTSRINLPILAAIDAFSFGIQLGLPTVLVLFSEFELHWNHYQASLFFSATNVARATILALILPVAIEFMRVFSRTTKSPATSNVSQSNSSTFGVNAVIIRLCLLFATLSYIGLAVSEQNVPFVLSGISSAVGSPVSVLAQSSMTYHVTADNVGELFGAISSLHAIFRALIPALMNFTYSLTLEKAPRTIFWGLSAFTSVAFLAATRLAE